METTIKIPWSVFLDAGVAAQEERIGLKLETPVLMKHQNYESDSQMYEMPDYVELTLIN